MQSAHQGRTPEFAESLWSGADLPRVSKATTPGKLRGDGADARPQDDLYHVELNGDKPI